MHSVSATSDSQSSASAVGSDGLPAVVGRRPGFHPLRAARFASTHRLIRPGYLRLLSRVWRRRLFTAAGWRMNRTGPLFLGKRVQLQVGKRGRVNFGRWVWIGDGSKLRCHEGQITVGSKTVMGQDCTLSAYQNVTIGQECIIADHVMMIDFDHSVVDVDRSIRSQGIYKRDVAVGSNVWIGHGAMILRGVTVGDNSIIGAGAVVTKDVPENAVVGGVPARVLRMREAPENLSWPQP